MTTGAGVAGAASTCLGAMDATAPVAIASGAAAAIAATAAVGCTLGYLTAGSATADMIGAMLRPARALLGLLSLAADASGSLGSADVWLLSKTNNPSCERRACWIGLKPSGALWLF